jgi:protein N-lysine methyltransferase METTL21D
LSPYVTQYTVTDIPELVPLIQKNVRLNYPKTSSGNTRMKPELAEQGSNISVQPLNWLVLNATPAHQRHRVISFPCSSAGTSTAASGHPDMILVVDCIYHPSLLPALVSTLCHLTSPPSTDTPGNVSHNNNPTPAVVVVVELRSAEVIRDFLTLWLESGPWEIWRVNGVLGKPYAVWVGWRGQGGSSQ